MARKFLLIVASLMALLTIYGCGQQAQQINNISNTPSNLSIKGTVYGYKSTELFLISPVNLGDPVAGAFVSLSGSSGTWNTRSDAKGEYSFTGIPDGSFTLAVTAEGFQEPFTFPFMVSGGAIKPSTGIPANGTITSFDVSLFPWPIITDYSPASGEVVSNNQVFTITFNKPMDQSTVKVNLIPQGLRTFSAPTSAQVNLTWDGSGKILTVTPIGQLISNECYKLEVFWEIDPVNGRTNGPQDLEGHKMMTPYIMPFFKTIFGFPVEINARENYSLYRVTTGGSLPGAPSNLKINYHLASGDTTEADAYDYWIALYNNPWVYLSWDSPASGGPITGYKIYTSNGSSSQYLKLISSPVSTNHLTTSVWDFEKTFWPVGTPLPWSDPVCSGNYPFINNPVRIKVVAYNGDGEGPGVEIVAQDTVSPKITTAESAGSGIPGAALFNRYYLPAIPPLSSGEAYIGLSEPVKPSTVSGNVTIAGVPLTATLLTQASELLVTPPPQIMAIIKLDAGTTNIRGKTVTLQSGLKDLAGNSPVAGSGDTIVLP